MVNWEAIKHWKVGVSRKHNRKMQQQHASLLESWQPPPDGELKFNFDVAFKDGVTTTGCILRNSNGTIVGAWVNRFKSDNPFFAEIEAAIQALKLANELNLERVSFEGDASNFVLALKGFHEFENWQAFSLHEVGCNLLNCHLFWSISFAPRCCNTMAHILAKWVNSRHFVGPVPPDLIDPTLWGVGVGD